MGLLIEWSEGSKVLTEDQIWVIGRDSSVDVRIESNKISRHHLQLMYESNKWVVKDLNSSNGTFKNGKPIQELVISDQLSLNLGAPEGQEISLSVTTGLKRKVVRDVPAELYSKIDPNKRISLTARTRIGRDPNNNIPVGDLSVSRSHAEITQNQSGGFDLVDLDSSSGTFLNGQRIKRRTLSCNSTTTFKRTRIDPITSFGL